LPGGDVRDVVISGNFAFLADFHRSFTSVDLTSPAASVLRLSTPMLRGGILQDVAVFGNAAAGTDVVFANGMGGELQIALNSRVSNSDTIPPCATSSSFSFTCWSLHFDLQSRVDSGPSLPNRHWCDINC
jgi:hypothetical protein